MEELEKLIKFYIDYFVVFLIYYYGGYMIVNVYLIFDV